MPSTATRQFIICIEQEPNYRTGLTQTVFNVREEPSREYVAASFRNLHEAQDWTKRPVCMFEAFCHNGHPFKPGVSVDYTPGQADPRWCDVCGEARREGWTESCDRLAEVRLFIRWEHDGDRLAYVCYGHAARIADDLAAHADKKWIGEYEVLSSNGRLAWSWTVGGTA
jgi:hypothetical protein